MRTLNCLVALLLAALLCAGRAAADEKLIEMKTDPTLLPGSATVRCVNSNDSSKHETEDHVTWPLRLHLQDNSSYHVIIDGQPLTMPGKSGWLTSFYTAHGEKDVNVGMTYLNLTIGMNVEPNYPRIGLAMLAAMLAVLGAGFALLRRRPAAAASQAVQEPLSMEQPKAVGKFKIVRRIARGGMGSVYEAEDEFGDHYALKVPSFDLFEDEGFRQRFGREIDIGKALHHPNIVRIYDYSFSPPYIAMELVRGSSFKDVLESEAPMSVEVMLRYMVPILQGLGYGHRHQIIHRDVKPSNILIDQGGTVKIADYGIARALTLETLTASGVTLGTPQYMAPEQMSTREADHRVDVYSVGVSDL